MPTDQSHPERRSGSHESAAGSGAAVAESGEEVGRAGNGPVGMEDGEEAEAEPVDRQDEGDGGRYPVQAPASDEFGREGWVLVAVLLVSFLVVPPAIVLLPEARGLIRPLGLTLRDAYLALPMIPAVLLGLTAVWAAVRHRRR